MNNKTSNNMEYNKPYDVDLTELMAYENEVFCTDDYITFNDTVSPDRRLNGNGVQDKCIENDVYYEIICKDHDKYEDEHEDEFTNKNNKQELYTSIMPKLERTSKLRDCVISNLKASYQCKECDYISSKPDKLVEHYQIHTEQSDMCRLSETDLMQNTKEMFQCSECPAVFDWIESCNNHIQEEHKTSKVSEELQSNDNNFINTIITKPKKPVDENLDTDNKSKKDEILHDNWLKPMPLKELKSKLKRKFIYKCSFKGCLYVFEFPEKRELHIKCHTSTDTGKVRDFKCSECSMEYKSWRNCTSHLWKEHKIDIDLLKCPLCDYKAGIAVKIFQHIQIHGTTKGFACGLCPKNFTQLAQLRQHSLTHLSTTKYNNNPMRWYTQKTCDICQHVFSTSKTLSKHVKTVHNKIKPFICNVCGYKSAKKSTWMIHTRQHTGEKPLQCKTCPFKASDPSVLTKHEMRHSKEHPYKCQYCTYSAVQTSTLKNHIRIKHPECNKSIKCDLCDFESINKDTLQKHIMDHNSGLIKPNEDSCETQDSSPKSLLKNQRQLTDGTMNNVEISSDCFLTVESTDSLAHDLPLDTGGVTIPAHSEDTQFPIIL